MRIKIRENSINLEELKLTLADHFSGIYKIKDRTKNILDVAESNTIGASVILTKKHVNINGGFPSMKGQMIFTILLIALGIVVPLIIYFLVFHKKMKLVEKDVAEFISKKYQTTFLT